MIELTILWTESQKLKREYYRFYLENEYHLWLDDYEFQTRQTTRHKWIAEKGYSRLEPRRYYPIKLSEAEVPLTDAIKDEVKKVLLSQLKIEKWSERK